MRRSNSLLALALVSSLGSTAVDPRVKPLPAGGFGVAWNKNRENIVGPFTQVVFTGFDTDDSRLYETPVTLETVFLSSIEADFATDSAGEVMVVWSGSELGFDPVVRARRLRADDSSDGGGFSFHDTPIQHGRAVVTSSSDDDFVAAWRSFDIGRPPPNTRFHLRRVTDPAQLGPVVGVDGPDHRSEHIAIDGLADGRFVAAWTKRGTPGDPSTLFVRTYLNGTPPTPVGATIQVEIVADDTDGTRVQLRTFTVPPVPGMISWWPGDGDATDAVGDNDGMLEGVTFGPANCGEAFLFDDPSDAMTVPDDLSLDRGTENFSLAFWVRTVDDEGVDAILDKRSDPPLTGYHAFLLDGRPGLQIADGGGSSTLITPRSIADGIAHFVVITVDRTALFGTRFWIDSVLDASYDTMNTAGSLDAAAPLVVGRRAPDTGSDAPFTGALDEIQLFDRVLTVDEIKQLYLRCARPFVDGFESGDTSRWAAAVP